MAKSKRGVERRKAPFKPEFPLVLPSGERIESDRRSGRDRRTLGQFARQGFFEGVSYSTIEDLEPWCEIWQLQPGDLLVSPDRDNSHLYLLLEGRLMIHLDRLNGTERVPIGPGECTGEISIIDGQRPTAYVVADVHCVVLAVHESRFWDQFIKQPRIARNFMRLFAGRFRARNTMIQQAMEERLRYEHLQKELAIAHGIQSEMLPRDPDLGPRVDLVPVMTPARHIGGDFYDAFSIGGDEFCVAIGDVSGKGIPAALFMVRAMTLLRAEMQKKQPLDRAMQTFNAALCEDNASFMFVTLVVGILNSVNGHFDYVIAGHNPVIFGRSPSGFSCLPQPAGILAGIESSATYELASLDFQEDDVLVLYTDGVTEAMNSDHELYGEQRLIDCVNRRGGAPAADVVDHIVDSVDAFVGEAEQSDDLTLVVIRWKSPAG